jgi:hypothetical protein
VAGKKWGEGELGRLAASGRPRGARVGPQCEKGRRRGRRPDLLSGLMRLGGPQREERPAGSKGERERGEGVWGFSF